MVITMQDNKNSSFCGGCGGGDGRGTVCIDTKRVLDCCRDRDCFEDVRVYLTTVGEEVLANATNVRTRCAKLLCAFVGVDEVPFNAGFFKVVVRYYIELEFEACVGVGRSLTFKGLAVLEKDVILYGGEGRAVTFSSASGGSFCGGCDSCYMSTNDPVAVVETVEPVVLGTKVTDCTCPCSCTCTDFTDIPEAIRNCFDSELVTNSDGPKITVSLGIFSVIRIERPAQLLVQATDYSVPDKECTTATNNDNPCELFRTIAFPTAQFRGTSRANVTETTTRGGNCGCNGGKNT